MVEVWATVKENPRYAVSNLGNVKNIQTGKLLKPRPTKIGYLRVHVSTEKGRTDFYIHRLVANAFCEHPNGSDCVNHIDFNIKNNNFENLEWVTQRSNVIHSMNHGRVPRFPNAIPVVGIKKGKKHYYRSFNEAACETGCDHKAIIKCCKNIYKQTHGYKWEYAEVSI